MNDKELRRGEVLGRVKRGELKLSEAAQMLEISYRQTKRIWRRYAAGGTKALRHGNVGRVSNRAKPAEVRKRANVWTKPVDKRLYGRIAQVFAAIHRSPSSLGGMPVARRPAKLPVPGFQWYRVNLPEGDFGGADTKMAYADDFGSPVASCSESGAQRGKLGQD